jgi:hypothetical protein
MSINPTVAKSSWGGRPMAPVPGEYVVDGGNWRNCFSCPLPDCVPSNKKCKNQFAHSQALGPRKRGTR